MNCLTLGSRQVTFNSLNRNYDTCGENKASITFTDFELTDFCVQDNKFQFRIIILFFFRAWKVLGDFSSDFRFFVKTFSVSGVHSARRQYIPPPVSQYWES